MEYYCAIRPNELRQLRLRDIDLEQQIVRIPAPVAKNRTTEYVNIPAQMVKLLRAIGIEGMNRDWLLFFFGRASRRKDVWPEHDELPVQQDPKQARDIGRI